ncbi:MAG: homoserine kinase [Burkholderiaceae bacterium]|jgi:homoserine kinase type II|nr:homoserine kinase [Burkholderiaceae bacterium]
MAVFTPVSLQELKPWLAHFPIDEPLDIQGISSGIENSNFFVTTGRDTYILTLFERLSADQLPYYLNLMHHLALRGVRVASPIADREGQFIRTLCGKPASLVTCLQGAWQENPSPSHCVAVGDMMARMHLAGQDYPAYQPNARGLHWWLEAVPQVLPWLSGENAAMLEDEIAFQQAQARSAEYGRLLSGPIHADLFRNNVMFHGETLSGFFDFYFAGNDTWLFDLAVAVNDWCIHLDTGEWDPVRFRAFVGAYQAIRPCTPEEAHLWQGMLRAAALRFWLSRLHDLYLPRAAEMLIPHDPTHFERILRLRRNETAPPLVVPGAKEYETH